jgi:hypothetical protein
MVRWRSYRLGLHPLKAQRVQIAFRNENINHANRIMLGLRELLDGRANMCSVHVPRSAQNASSKRSRQRSRREYGKSSI